jgi:hypothetical protein
LFIFSLGYPRSGHSLIGALLNAHPNMVIAHELGDLKYAYLGFKRWQIYYLLMKKAELSAEKDCKLGGYNYNVPNQWQGKFNQIQVIGDKQGEGTILRIQANLDYLQRLRQTINVPLQEICQFLGVDTTEKYLEDCAKIVYNSPNKSRYSITWTPELIDTVQDKIERYPFLSGYNYNN